MDDKLAKVIEKIKKLLALADKNTNEQEANAALLKARALMKEYKVQITDTENEKERKYARMYGEHKYDYAFRKPLARILAKNFCCESYISNKKVMFLGREEDVVICTRAFNYAYNYILIQATKKYNEAYYKGEETKGVFNGYAKGFLIGMKRALDEQCKALVLVMPDDVKQKIQEFEKANNVREGADRMRKSTDTKAFKEGLKDGKEYAQMKEKRLTA